MNNRGENIKKGKLADEKIIEHLKKLDGFINIIECKDYQVELKQGKELTRSQHLQNNINMIGGTDYVLVMKGGNLEFRNLTGDDAQLNGFKFRLINIDTKGFNYSLKNNGVMYSDGTVERLLLQIGKYYGGVKYKGWANNPHHLTSFIVMNVGDWVYYLDYKKLVVFMQSLNRSNTVGELFPKGGENYEVCLKVPVKGLLESGVITAIVPL